jgi:hypothetical protein
MASTVMTMPRLKKSYSKSRPSKIAMHIIFAIQSYQYSQILGFSPLMHVKSPGNTFYHKITREPLLPGTSTKVQTYGFHLGDRDKELKEKRQK